MNHELSLSLELLGQDARGFRFRVTFQNRSADKLFLPFPEIHGLRFAATATMQEAEWYTSLLVSAVGEGFALKPGTSRPFEWRVRPCDIERPQWEDRSDYYRWCVDLPVGEYFVWFRWRVDSEFFDPDSHMRLPDLEYLAARENAIVWLGEVVSNRLEVARTEPGTALFMMSDAKWRKFFATIGELDIGPLRWKFIRDDRIFVETTPPADAILERTLGDVLPYPYAPYREIEWIEIPAVQAMEAIQALAVLNQFPIQQSDSGVRVLGCTW